MRAGLLLSLIGIVAWTLSGFLQGTLRHSSDPELVLGAAEGVRALGLVAIVAAGVLLGRRSSH